MDPRNAKLGGILLAAGLSRRFGPENKLLAEVQGKPLVRKVAEVLLAQGLGRLVVVLGHEATLVERSLAGLEVECVINPDYGYGMGRSLAVGAEVLLGGSFTGILVCLSDLPFLQTEDVAAVCDGFWKAEGERITVPVFQGKRGHPVCFPSRCLSAMSRLTGDGGAKPIIRSDAFPVQEVTAVGYGCIEDMDT